MADGFGDVYVDTRRQLRGVAESLIAGPQHRASGTIRLAVRPGGFTGVALPVSVHGRDLIWLNGGAPLAGPLSAIAEAAGVDIGPPKGVYDLEDPLPSDAVLDLDAGATEWIHRSHYAGGHALKYVLPECHPVLWPEHFDVAATEDEVTYGVSAGDHYHLTPYAYISPWAKPRGPFWNAPFGALYPLNPAHDVDALTSRIADFFVRGRKELPNRQ
jgi:hypothetical protein